ncbi:MAG: PKD domain-containing protein [Thermoguttaceae bacterium]|jgi:murein DD-endopeptidase MepM/ murein hydrolase activator NlpD|nr:PKD domain-containing protein [Thermoguttaceae bacterium]
MKRVLCTVFLVTCFAASGQTAESAVPAPSGDAISSSPGSRPIEPLVRVVDLRIGQETTVELADGSTASVRLIDVKETRDSIRQAVRKTEVVVEVNGRRCTLAAGLYYLPITVAGVRIDCPVTAGYNVDNTRRDYALEADARLRLWPADSPLLRPVTFRYPVRQRWFATLTWSDIEPIDGGSKISTQVGYHNGLDIGGAEGMVEIIAATDALVVSSRLEVLDEYDEGAPVQPRYDVVYLRDDRGWYYRYSHFQSIDPEVVPGRVLKQGDRLGVLGKEGASGGWSHLHFHISSRQPSGEWGLQNAYAFLHEAYRDEYKPAVLACARPQQLIRAGDTAELDGTQSWSACGAIREYHWTFSDGTTATGPRVQREFPSPGKYSEILRVTDSEGNVDYDFAVVQVIDPQRPDQYTPSLHATYAPTFGIRPGAPVTFQVRAFRTTEGEEEWDFGDGSPPVRTRSDGNVKPRAPDGYAKVVHRYEKPGHYLVHVRCQGEGGIAAHARLHVRVEAEQ